MDEEQSDTASRILKAATTLLAEGGYEALSMRRIAAMVGLSQAAIYRHYADKAELMDRVVAAGYGTLLARMEAVGARGLGPAETIRAAIGEYVAFALEKADLFKALLLRDAGPARGRLEGLSPGLSRTRATFALLVGLLERGMAEGEFAQADPELTAQALWAAMFGLAARAVLERNIDPERRRVLVERHSEILLRGLRP